MILSATWSKLQFGEELNFHIRLLIEAIGNVRKEYLWYNGYIASEEISTCKEHKYEHLERVFAYELYHQWSILLKKNNSELMINSEISKAVGFDDKTTVFPDFVLHKGQEDKEHQYIVCEVKRRTSITKDKIGEDIDALVSYVDKNILKFNFKVGIFILSGAKRDFLKNEIRNLTIKENWKLYSKQILCITYDNDMKNEEYSMSVDTLEDIINNKDNQQ